MVAVAETVVMRLTACAIVVVPVVVGSASCDEAFDDEDDEDEDEEDVVDKVGAPIVEVSVADDGVGVGVSSIVAVVLVDLLADLLVAVAAASDVVAADVFSFAAS